VGCFRDLFHYSAYHLADIADTARDVDLAIRWGYGWSQGPFETWQAAGWKQVAGWIAEDIAAGKAMSDAPLPDWVFDGRDGVHGAEGSYSARRKGACAALAAAGLRAPALPGPAAGRGAEPGETVFENDGVRMWHRRRRHRRRELQDQDAHVNDQRAGRPAGGHRRSPSATSPAW
jgi:3-hydroxyacyl-CoA dehydrogenase